MRNIIILLAAWSGLCASLSPAAHAMDDRVVYLLVTSQKYDYASPWQMGDISRSNATGCVIDGNMILTSAYAITDHSGIEVMKKGESRKYQAEVYIKDYHCGLALLRVKDRSFFKGLKPVEFGPSGKIPGRAAVVYRWDSLSSLKEYSANLTKASIRFYEPGCSALMYQFSTSMNEGGNGEPVFIDGRLAGVAAALSGESKTLYVLGIDVVLRMLKDAGDGDYRGVPFFWIDGVELRSDVNLRDYFGVAAGDGGVLVTGVPAISSGGESLRINDIIQSIDGHRIDDSGMYDSPYGKLYYYGLVQLDHQVGDSISMVVLRDRRQTTLRFTLKPVPDECCAIPLISHDRGPRYCVVGGLVFQELSAGYLELYGRDWKKKADKRLVYYYDSVKSLVEKGPEVRVVVLTRVLPDTVNKGYQQYHSLVLNSVNGVSVKNLTQMKKLVDRAAGDYLVFSFVGETTVVLDKNEASRGESELMQKYNVTAPHNIPDVN
ncbi:MAG: trypsin-like serine protease [Spirochaetes bacterium]|nr:trypsin-like serine protease [Spirochaetota bacterium]